MLEGCGDKTTAAFIDRVNVPVSPLPAAVTVMVAVHGTAAEAILKTLVIAASPVTVPAGDWLVIVHV